LFKDQPEDGPTNRAETCRWHYNLIKYKVVSDCIIYILSYIQHSGDVSLKKKSERWRNFTALIFFLGFIDFKQNVVLWSNGITVTVTYAILMLMKRSGLRSVHCMFAFGSKNTTLNASDVKLQLFE
jgi:hypothetical protein